MSENQNRGAMDLAKYDAMATEELKQILRLDSEAPRGQELDTEEILYIMEVLAGREKETIAGKTAQEAWESFQRDYLPEEEDISSYTHEAKKPFKPQRPWLRRLTAVAAVIALVLCISTTADALSWKDIWNAVARWAKETFSFVGDGETLSTEPSEADSIHFSSLQQILAETNCPTDFIPSWIPEGYVLQDVTIDENPMQRVYIAMYKNGDKSFMITVRSFLESDLETVEINDEPLEIYEVSGLKYYILENLEQTRAIWVKDSFECYISGELTITEIKMMIDSIGKG